MEVGRISPEFFDFELSPRGEHGEGGQGFASVDAILPGRRSGRHIFGPRHCGIPQEDLPRAGPSNLSALTSPLRLTIVDAFACVSSSAVISLEQLDLGIGF